MTSTEVEPSSDGEFEAMALDGFEAIMAEERDEPTADRQLVITCSVTGSTPSVHPPSQPEVKCKGNKPNIPLNVPARNTRSKAVNPALNTRSKKRIC